MLACMSETWLAGLLKRVAWMFTICKSEKAGYVLALLILGQTVEGSSNSLVIFSVGSG